MSTSAVSTSSIGNGLQTYFQARNSDLQKLGKALASGDLDAAKQEMSAIQTLGQSGPFANGAPFKIAQREQDFEAIGQALQSGDLAGAQKAFAELKSTFQYTPAPAPSPAVTVNLSGAAPASTAASPAAAPQPVAASSTASPNGPDIILNLGNVTPGEQITIGLSNGGNSGEQLTVGVTQPNQSPEQITLNLNQNSNQQIILNLFNSTAASAPQGSGVSLTA